jgi:hypothetical protein
MYHTKDLRSGPFADYGRAAAAYRDHPERRATWFPSGPPQPPVETKAAPYELPPAQPAGLPPELQAQVDDLARSRARGWQEPCCRAAEAAGQSWAGLCVKHKGTPTQRAQDRQWRRHAAATQLAQQLAAGQLGNPVRVVPVGQAIREDSLRAEVLSALDALLLGP